jgi:hypothetical protein
MKSILLIFVTISLVLFGQYALSQPTVHTYCIVITNSNTTVKGQLRALSMVGEGALIKTITIKDSLNKKIKLEDTDLWMLLSSEKPFSTIDQLDERGVVFESLTIDKKNKGLAQLLNWKTSGKLKVYYGPPVTKRALPKGLFGIEDGFEYGEQTFWISKQGSNPLLISKKNFEEELNLLFADCPSFHAIFNKTKAKYRDLLTYVNDYNRLCFE